MSSRSISWV